MAEKEYKIIAFLPLFDSWDEMSVFGSLDDAEDACHYYVDRSDYEGAAVYDPEEDAVLYRYGHCHEPWLV